MCDICDTRDKHDTTPNTFKEYLAEKRNRGKKEWRIAEKKEKNTYKQQDKRTQETKNKTKGIKRKKEVTREGEQQIICDTPGKEKGENIWKQFIAKITENNMNVEDFDDNAATQDVLRKLGFKALKAGKLLKKIIDHRGNEQKTTEKKGGKNEKETTLKWEQQEM